MRTMPPNFPFSPPIILFSLCWVSIACLLPNTLYPLYHLFFPISPFPERILQKTLSLEFCGCFVVVKVFFNSSINSRPFKSIISSPHKALQLYPYLQQWGRKTCFSTHHTRTNYLEKSSVPPSEQFGERAEIHILVTLVLIFYYHDLTFLQKSRLSLSETLLP